MEFFHLAAPRSASELAVMESMLIAHQIPFYVHNRGFGGLYPGMQVSLYNIQRVMVPVAYEEASIELFGVFREGHQESFVCAKLGMRDRLRGVAEVLLGGWAVPFRYREFLPANDELDRP